MATTRNRQRKQLQAEANEPVTELTGRVVGRLVDTVATAKPHTISAGNDLVGKASSRRAALHAREFIRGDVLVVEPVGA